MEKKLKETLGDYFKALATKHDLEEEEIVEEFEKRFERISKAPSMKMAKEPKILKRTKAKMQEYFRNIKKKGESYVFIPFGHISKPRDFNKEELDYILRYTNAGRIPELLSQGKIMYRVDGGKRIPVSNVRKYGKRTVYVKGMDVYLKPVADGDEVDEFYPEVSTDLQPGKKNVIPRDSRLYSSDKHDRVNWRWTRELQSAYSAEVQGLAFPKDDEDDVRMFKFRLRGEQANPTSQNFFFRKYLPFRVYEADFSMDLKDGVFNLNYIGQINPSNGVIEGVDDNNIDDVIDANLDEIRERYATEGVDSYVPPVIYIDGIEKYHKTTCKLDGSGKTMKSPKGWDMTEWGKYAILISDLSSSKLVTDPSKSNFYLFSDGDVDYRIGGFGDPSLFNTPKIENFTPTMTLINTSRGPTKYNFKTREREPAPEDGDINLNVRTIRALPRVDIEIEEEDFD